ncbi:glycerophosphodiester phosphodiesterase family protein [Pseudaminobacter arsenicus]|uniref:Glycerophosphodiester phosphodiesterase family protein n=1 Tax=Borborobacter arsenicus TaxID=1851146 RepID=A0A432V7G2_9HYPH|nr:glycerophosphodiester phosphodiesterase family protein [Pseudaminobacter arsenicus]RUM98013.1 glycerophosphodiester phosphodiesterase family protein [Pseudaminobacter arsenicus]
MRNVTLGAALLAFLGQAVAPVSAQGSDIAQIIERFENANQWRDHVMIVAHRAGWKQGGLVRRAENSLAAIHHSIDLGIEMVEVDVRRTGDGALIIMHDSWLDRTTTCKGEVIKYSLEQIRSCRLVIEGSGVATDETVPTFREMLEAARGRIMVNVDNKLDVHDLPEIVAVARDLGMERQVVIKQNLWSSAKIAEMKMVMSKVGEGAHFMPILADDAVKEARFMEAASSGLSADAAELIVWRGDGQEMVRANGALFNARARAAAVRGDWHLWVNTFSIVNKPGGMLAGGRGDELAVLASFPEETYGFWAEQGVTMIQTDEPEAALDWLTVNGYRVPYDLTN